MWGGVSPSVGEAAEVMYRGFFEHLMGVRIFATFLTQNPKLFATLMSLLSMTLSDVRGH